MKKQEETADEKTLGKFIAASLREQLAAAVPDCPETEVLAAFFDRTLTDREHADCERHLLTCLRCQEYLAELARLSDADERPVVLEEEAAAAEAAEKPGWYFRLAWVLPFLIIALGSAIWFQEDLERYIERRREMAMKAPAPLAGPPARERDAGAKQEAAPARAAENLAKTAAPSAPAPTRAQERAEVPAVPAAAPTTASQAPTPGAIAPPSTRAELQPPPKPAERPAAMSIEAKKTQAADFAAPAPAAGVVAAQTAEPAMTAAGKEAAGRLDVRVRGAQPKFTPTWRVGKRGTIQRADEGGGWIPVPSGVNADLFDITFAGAAGWAVGHEGTVLRSTDGGNSWTRVSAPSNEDLVRVSAQSADQAQAISRSGKSFSTTDGGRTWK